jgi:uncharacterized protein YjbI with pentapeptide repeats
LLERIGTVVLILIVILIGVSILGYLCNWKWTGLHGTTEGGPKTLWDWLDLLIIPVVLAAGALWFRKEEQEIERIRSEAEAHTARFVAEQRAQEAALETYFDRMSELLLDKDNPLLASKAGSAYQEMAFTRTVTVLRRLDTKRRNLVFDFLRDARLLGIKTQREVRTDAGTKRMEVESDPVAIFAGRNMQGIDLSEANLSEANLEEANLSGTDLSRANLRKANLIGAELYKAKLGKANLSEAHLDVAKLTEADMKGADLSGVYMPGANLEGANLQEVRIIRSPDFLTVLPYAELREANLSGADLRGAYVDSATMNEVNLTGANLTGAVLRATFMKARLYRANLSEADLSSNWMVEAKLYGANLSKANLSKTHLSGADLREADLNGADLSEAELGPHTWGSGENQRKVSAADLRKVSNLTCVQLKQAKNWEKANRDDELRCGAEIPELSQDK